LSVWPIWTSVFAGKIIIILRARLSAFFHFFAFLPSFDCCQFLRNRLDRGGGV